MWFSSEKIIFDKEAQGTHIQVIDKMGRRELRFGNKVVQSALAKTNPDYLLLSYTRHMALGLVLLPQAQNILHIGLGGGNLPRFIHKYFPKPNQDVIELNPTVIEVAHNFFNLPDDDRIQMIIGDGFETMSKCEKKYDLIFLDAFEATGTPSHLNTTNFFKLLKQALNPEGWVIGNAWTTKISISDQLNNWRDVFETVLQAPVPVMGNVIIFGGAKKMTLEKAPLKQKARKLQQGIPLKFIKLLEYLESVDIEFSPDTFINP